MTPVMRPKEHAGLTFSSWQEMRPFSLALLGFFALSLLIHALSFYVFQLAYPPSAHINPPPAQLSVLMPGSSENNALLRRIEAEDPALTARPPEVLPADLLNLRYIPSFAQVRAAPKMVEKQPPALIYPPVMNAPALVRSALPHQPQPVVEEPAPQTQVRFSGDLARRKIVTEMPKHPASHDFTELQPARFLIGVSDRGEVRYVFLQNSSGDKALDAQTAIQLQQLEFAHAPEPLVWGFATFAWGSDAFPSNATPGVLPKAP